MVKKISNDTLINKSMVKLPIFDEKTISKQGEMFYDLKTDSIVIKIGEGWKFFPTTTEFKLNELDNISVSSLSNCSTPIISSAPPSYDSTNTNSIYPNLYEQNSSTIHKHEHEHVIKFSSLFPIEFNFKDIENKLIELNNTLSDQSNIKKIKLKNDFSFFEFLKNRFKNVKISPSGDIKFEVTKGKYLE